MVDSNVVYFAVVAKREKTKWVVCATCGHQQRNHRILCEKKIAVHDDIPISPTEYTYHRLVECMGCETIKYVVSTFVDSDDNPPWENSETDVNVYPDSPTKGSRVIQSITQDNATDDDGEMLIPVTVWKMYRETIDALNANARTLSAGGLRATVEGICLDSDISDGNLQNKIDELARRGLLTSTQAELLHEERYLGNSALHELSTPTAQDIEDGLRIVEGLINTIYILPSKAKRLKERREFKKSGGLKAAIVKSKKP